MATGQCHPESVRVVYGEGQDGRDWGGQARCFGRFTCASVHLKQEGKVWALECHTSGLSGGLVFLISNIRAVRKRGKPVRGISQPLVDDKEVGIFWICSLLLSRVCVT